MVTHKYISEVLIEETQVVSTRPCANLIVKKLWRSSKKFGIVHYRKAPNGWWGEKVDVGDAWIPIQRRAVAQTNQVSALAQRRELRPSQIILTRFFLKPIAAQHSRQRAIVAALRPRKSRSHVESKRRRWWRRPDCQAHRGSWPGQSKSSCRTGPWQQRCQIDGLLQGKEQSLFTVGSDLHCICIGWPTSSINNLQC
jgi:hypothetical protein